MTNEEQQMLQALAERVNRTPVADKDNDAEQMIAQTLGKNPDALYVLAQTVLVQDYALGQARRQIADLTARGSQATPARSGGSFLGNLLGRHEAAAAPPVPAPAQAQYQQAPLYAPAGGYPLPGSNGPQSGGFLRSAMQTAAGVTAGALAFEGIETLMHGFGHAAGYGADFGGGGFGSGPREEIVNNYYGDSGPGEHGREAAFGGEEHQHNADYTQMSNGAATGDAAHMQDASYTTDPQDVANTDADDLSGTADTDYTSQGDDSMLSDDVGDGGSGDSGGDSGGDGGDGV